MRTRLLLSTLVALAACSDPERPTGPASFPPGPSARSASGGDVGTQVVQSAKPTDQVGLTKVGAYWSSPVAVNAGEQGNATVICPAGTVPTGGGFEYGGSGGTPPTVWRSRSHSNGNTADGWMVAVTNQQAGATAISITAFVNCAS